MKEEVSSRALVTMLVVMLAAALVFMIAPLSQASPGWVAPLNISPGSTTYNQEPQIALDSTGHSHVVWTGYDGSTNRVYYSANTGAGWSAPLNISPGSTPTSNGMPQIALDSDGHPHVVWHGNDGSNYRVYYSANTGAGWSAPLNIPTGSTTYGLNPRMALDSGGHPHVVWFGNDGSQDRIYYSTNAGTGWTAPVDLSTSSTSNWTPQIALDSGGYPHVVWRGSDGSQFRVFYSVNTGSGWSSPLNISPGTVYGVSDPQIVLDTDGNPQVAWEGDDGSTYRIWYSAKSGSSWTAPLILSTSTNDNYSSQMALDPAGNPHVVWYGHDGSTYRIYYSANTGAGWSTPLTLSPDTTDNSSPRMSIDAEGNSHVVWWGSDGATHRVYYSANTGSGWSAPLNLSPGSITESYDPQIALDSGGNPHVVWFGNDGATNRVYYSGDVSNTFYFAEGYTGEGFQEYLCLGNPGDVEVTVDVTYLFKDGTSLERGYTVPALSRFTADVNAEVGAGRDVSIKCTSASAFVAERPMYFDYTGGGGSWTGGSDAIGATLPSGVWYFAEGYTGEGFDEWVCVLNPGGSEAHLTFNFQTQEEGLVVPAGSYTVAAHSRATFKANDLLENKSYQTSLKLVSDVPVVAERPMYFNYQGTGSWGWTGGHDVMGVPSLARDYYFAEGYTGGGFEEWLTLQNPGDLEITVHAVYQLGSGVPIEKDYLVPAATRATVYVPTEVGPDQNVSVHLSSGLDFLAERPMYFSYSGTGAFDWTGGHCVIGATSPADSWFFAEGYTGENFEEWLCIQNPGAVDAQVEITYYPEGGSPIVKDAFTVAANSRYTVNVNSDAGSGLSICAGVFSDQPVIVERPMYFNFGGKWTGGHDVVGFRP